MHTIQKKILKISFLFFISFPMLACQHKKDYQYFMTHPELIKSVYQTCQSESSSIQSQECQAAFKAGKDFEMLYMEMESDPLEFGQKILKTQQHLAKTKATLEAMRKRRRSDREGFKQVSFAEQQVEEKVARYLAVVRLATSER